MSQGKNSMVDSRIVITFTDQAQDKVYFKVRGDIQIKKVLQSYCNETQVEYGTVDFYLEGNRVPRRGTVAQAGLKEDDVIDVVAPVYGGGPSNSSC